MNWEKIKRTSTYLKCIAQYNWTINYCTRWDIKYFPWFWLTQVLNKRGFITKTIMLSFNRFVKVFCDLKHNQTLICHAYVRVWFHILLLKVKINSIPIVCLRIAKLMKNEEKYLNNLNSVKILIYQCKYSKAKCRKFSYRNEMRWKQIFLFDN